MHAVVAVRARLQFNGSRVPLFVSAAVVIEKSDVRHHGSLGTHELGLLVRPGFHLGNVFYGVFEALLAAVFVADQPALIRHRMQLEIDLKTAAIPRLGRYVTVTYA